MLITREFFLVRASELKSEYKSLEKRLDQPHTDKKMIGALLLFIQGSIELNLALARLFI